MIWGRPVPLWLGILQAVLNVAGAAIVVMTGQPVTEAVVTLFTTLNALGAAIIAVVANVQITDLRNKLARTASTPPTQK